MAIIKILAALFLPILAVIFYQNGSQDGSPAFDAQPPAQELAVKVVTREARVLSSGREFQTVGTGRAFQSIQIHPAVNEEVVEVLFKGGERVEASQVLIRLDDRDEKLAVELAEVRLKEARALLSRISGAARSSAVAETELVVAQARVDFAEVQLKQARLELEYRTIQAPFAGVVGIPTVDAGDRVAVGDNLAPLDDRHAVLVDFEAPELLLSNLRVGLPLVVRTPAWPEEEFEGRIEAISPRVDSQKRTLRLRTRIPNPEDKLRAGMSFSTRLTFAGADYPSVPEISLKWSRDGSYVWVVRNQKAQKVFGRVVTRREGYVLLDAPIEDKEDIVVAGAERLRNGRTVATETDRN